MNKDKRTALSLGNVAVLCAGVGFLSILFAGAYSDPYLADEVFHYRLAGYIYDLWAIPDYDPLLHTNPLTGKNHYVNEPLWHSLLAVFWTLTGRSQFTGQMFQAFIYLGMVLSAFLLGKKLHSTECGYYTSILVASSPFVILYSVLFHVDIFLMLLSTLCYLMILSKRFAWTGILLGLAFITKRNAYFIAPAIAFCVLYYSDGMPKERVKKLLIFLLAFSVIVAPEFYRRHGEFSFYGTKGTLHSESTTSSRTDDTPIPEPPTIIMGETTVAPAEQQPLVAMPEQPAPSISGEFAKRMIMEKISLFVQPRDTVYKPKNKGKPYGQFIHPESILKPSIILIYFGLPLIIISIITMAHLCRRKVLTGLFGKKHILIYVTVSSFLIVYAICFFNNWGLRYMSPILIFAFLLGGYGFTTIKGRGWDYLKYILVLGCIVQIVVTASYIQKYRKIPPGVIEAYEYANKYISPVHLTLSSKGAFALYADKPALWHSNCAPVELDYVFWKADEKETKEILGRFGIHYLFIDKDRIYDDSKVHHVLGYPISFVKKLETFDCMKLIFNNRHVAIWQIRDKEG